MNTNEMITIIQMNAGAKLVRAQYLSAQPMAQPFDQVERPKQYAGRSGGIEPAGMGHNPFSGGDYHFKNVIGVNLEVGDIIVCETKGTFALLSVTDPDVKAPDLPCSMAELKHVVAKVNNDKLAEVKAQEVKAHEALSMSEVNKRLTDYRSQIGVGTFNNVAGLLGLADADEVIDQEPFPQEVAVAPPMSHKAPPAPDFGDGGSAA